MVTITINIENGNEASEACREVARLIENGYTSGMFGCSGDTFEIEGDIFSDEEGYDDEFTPTESGKTEVRIEAVSSHCYPSSYLGDMVYTSRLRLTELFGEDNGGDKTTHEFSLVFDVKFKDGTSDQFGVDLYDWKYGEMAETDTIIWNIGCNDSFNSSIAREVIDMLIGGRMENDEYKIFEVKKKTI